MLTTDEVAFHANEFYNKHKFSPRLRDLPELPFSKRTVNILFGKWSDMLRYANLPLNRYPPRLMKCEECSKMFKKQVKEIRKCLKHFCSKACNAKYYTTGRKHTEETKQKISESLKAHRIFFDV